MREPSAAPTSVTTAVDAELGRNISARSTWGMMCFAHRSTHRTPEPGGGPDKSEKAGGDAPGDDGAVRASYRSLVDVAVRQLHQQAGAGSALSASLAAHELTVRAFLTGAMMLLDGVVVRNRTKAAPLLASRPTRV